MAELNYECTKDVLQYLSEFLEYSFDKQAPDIYLSAGELFIQMKNC